MPMTVEQFETSLRRLDRTREEALAMLANAKQRKNHEFVAIADQVISERFPEPALTARKGSAIPTKARFKDQIVQCDSSKDAYLYLVNQFCQLKPELLDDRRTKRYKVFSRNRGTWADCVKLNGDWYANVGINNRVKFDILVKLGVVCGLAYQHDWDFDTEQTSLALSERLESMRLGVELLAELMAMKDDHRFSS